MSPNPPLTRKDFASDQDVRWCPGCGDYAILAAMQRTLPDLGVRPEETVFISGIGCAARFPYYMNTYGFHTIHGRAPAFATGLKIVNPKLDVWVISGDGDALSIGGNHLLHVLRRNVNLQFLLFNNRIYGLTKGQYSPTSKLGQRSPSTPLGSIDTPVSPCLVALGAGARFVARGYDTAQKQLPTLFRRAWEHQGASFVEILQNCPVFNDGAFGAVLDRKQAAESQIWVEHGKPLLFGGDTPRGLRIKPGKLELEVVGIGASNGKGSTVSESDILVHDETNHSLAFLLAQLQGPTAFGVLYNNPAEPYDQLARAQVVESAATVKQDHASAIDALLKSGHTWTV